MRMFSIYVDFGIDSSKRKFFVYDNRAVKLLASSLVADNISLGMPIPVSPIISEGCFGISTKTFKLLQSPVDQNKTIYLYAVCH